MKILYCERGLSEPEAPGMALPPVTLLTDSSLSRNYLPLFLPPHSRQWKITFGVALRIIRLGKYISARFAPRYYDAFTVIARLRPADLELPATACLTAFDSSVVVGDWQPLVPAMSLDGALKANVKLNYDLINLTIESLSRYFTLKTGDIVVAGDFDGSVVPVVDTRITVSINDITVMNVKIK